MKARIIASLLVAGTASAACAQDSFSVRGRIFDFTAAHPDFAVTSGEILDQTAGLVDLTMVGNVPTLSGNGADVSSLAYDSDGNLIALHMARGYDVLLEDIFVLESSPNYRNGPTIDGYDPAMGGYGGSNVLPAPVPSFVPSLPPITVPNVGPNTGSLSISKDKNYVINSDLHVQNFTCQQQTNVSIVGDVTIVVDGDFLLRNNCTIDLANANSSVTFYILGDANFDNRIRLGMSSQDHTRIRFFFPNSTTVDIGNNTDMYASIVAPDTEVYIHNGADFHGAIVAERLRTRNGGVGLHFAGTTGNRNIYCNFTPDTEGAYGSSSNGSIFSDASFAHWFTETPGVNASTFARYGFVQEPSGEYVMDRSGYDPINGELYGNEGMPNNGNFTVHIDANFNYRDCAGNFLEATADCEMWVYINRELVIDLTGHVPGNTQRIDFDRLRLNDGEMYDLDIYVASRNARAPNFSVRTDIPLFTNGDVDMPTFGRYD